MPRTLCPAIWILLHGLVLLPYSTAAEPLVPAGSINAAHAGGKRIVVAQDDPAIRRHAEAMQRHFYKNAELIDDKQALGRTFAGADLVVYGTPAHGWLARAQDRLPFRFEDGAVVLEGRRFTGKRLRVICAVRNPDDAKRRAVLYVAGRGEDVSEINSVFHGPTEWVVADGTRILGAGSFIGPSLPPEQLQTDLDELAGKIKRVHPAAIDGMPAELQASFAAARRALAAPMRRDEFWLVLSRAVQPLHDAHTTIQPPLSGQTLHLPFVWLREGMIVSGDAGPLRKGDKILRIGGCDEAQLLARLREILPAENEHWVRRQGESLLRELDLLRMAKIAMQAPAPVTVERGGKEIEVLVALADSQSSRDEAPWVRFVIDEKNNLGIFALDQCTNNEMYQKTLERFFAAVAEKKITRIGVDVRRNGGGNSSVVNEFLRYLDVASYKTPGNVVRWSEEARTRQAGLGSLASGVTRRQPGEMQNRRVENPFRGQLFVLTSKATFSSGNWFALLVQDNKLGTIVGEPTGNAPSSYGDILTFSLPHSALSFTVSYKKWLRPDPNRDPADCVAPDELVPVTRRDLLEGSDPLMQHLRNRAR
jgi:C-terminal processing protease CtpA/Prc